MKFILFLFFLIGLTVAQTRPTGGTGPDGNSLFDDDESFNIVVSLVETAVEINFYGCQTGMIRPKTFSLKEIYQLLNSMYALDYITRMNTHTKYSPIECEESIMKLTPKMMCLIKGTELSFELLSKYPRGEVLLKKQYN